MPSQVLVVRRALQPRLQTRPPSSPHFESADIRSDLPADPALPCGYIDITPGGHVRIHMTLRSMILETQGEQGTHRIVEPSNRMDATCWQITARTPVQPDASLGRNGPEWNGVDIGVMREMLRTLLAQRFGLRTHIEDQQVSGYALVATAPHLNTADRSGRPTCTEGWGPGEPPPGWQDPRILNPLASRLVTCRNVTLAELAPELNRLITGVDGPVIDATGLRGRFDFSLSFSPGRGLPPAPPTRISSRSHRPCGRSSGLTCSHGRFRHRSSSSIMSTCPLRPRLPCTMAPGLRR
jgi:uncharacterized protein (TIGR03435 family)